MTDPDYEPNEAARATPNKDVALPFPQRFDKSKVKLGPGALPSNIPDPLRWEEFDEFWQHVDFYFAPATQEDLAFIKHHPANSYQGTAGDPALHLSSRVQPRRQNGNFDHGKKLSDAPRDQEPNSGLKDSTNDRGESTNASEAQVGLRSNLNGEDREDAQSVRAVYPYTQRLLAALIDEGGGSSFVNDALRGKQYAQEMSFWIGPAGEAQIRPYQRILEGRIKHELRICGMLKPEADEELHSEMLFKQWQLRDSTLSNFVTLKSLCSRMAKTELRKQALNREYKKYANKTEKLYLERMMDVLKKNKKSRAKYQKIYNGMTARYRERRKTPATEHENESKAISKSRHRSSQKRKKRRIEPIPLAIDFADLEDDNIEQYTDTVRSIILDYGGESTMDQIVTGFMNKEKGVDTIEAARKLVQWTLVTARTEHGQIFRRKGNHRYSLNERA